MKSDIAQLLVALPVLIATFPSLARDPEEDIQEALGAQDTVSIVSGYSQPSTSAPAVTTVITARDIERLGATTIDQVLDTVPGLQVATSRGVIDVYAIRGAYDEFNTYLLLLINGIPVNDPVNAGKPSFWSMPVRNISRIEIVRGPASAVYGADAVAGVINVITKTADDIEGAEAGVHGGRFDTYGGWLLAGKRWGDLALAFSLQARSTEGPRNTIPADEQTRIDRALGTQASLAPGPLNAGREDIDARLDVSGDRWRLRVGYQGFHDVETGAGVTLALDPAGEFDIDLFNADLTYTLVKQPAWDVEAQVSFFSHETAFAIVAYPPGAFGFPEGVQRHSRYRLDQWRADVSALYTGWPKHRLRFGGTYGNARVMDVHDQVNYIEGPFLIPLPAPLPPGQLGDVEDLGVAPFLTKEQRWWVSGFLHDEWQFAPAWTLTTGVRVDHYADFGTTINPRLSLVWSYSPTLTIKALYGRAFRAPSFNELYSQGAAIGNPDLEPEILDMLELALTQQWSPRFGSSLSLFWYALDNQITAWAPDDVPFPLTNVNGGEIRGYGLELEARYQASRSVTLAGHYAYQTATDRDSHETFTVAAQHQLYGELNWWLTPRWSLNARAKWLGGWERLADDPREDLDDYWLASAALRWADPQARWDFTLGVDNLFDEDAREPSTAPASLPDDFPVPGRRVTAQFRVKF